MYDISYPGIINWNTKKNRNVSVDSSLYYGTNV